MIKRFFYLIILVGLMSGLIAWVFVRAATSAPQLKHRVQKNWMVGELELGEPTRRDVNHIEFEFARLKLSKENSVNAKQNKNAKAKSEDLSLIRQKNAARLLGDYASMQLQMNSVLWLRGALFQKQFAHELSSAEIQFKKAQLQLPWTGNRPPSVNPLFQAIAASVQSSEMWPRKLSGDQLKIDFFKQGGKPDDFSITMEEIRLRQVKSLQEGEADHHVLNALVQSKDWKEGDLSWKSHSKGHDVHLQLSGLKLPSTNFERWSQVLSFPWLSNFPKCVEGKGELSWKVGRGLNEVRLKHYRMVLQIIGLKLPLSFLVGELILRPDELNWRISRGRMSQTKLSGDLQYQGSRHFLRANLQLSDFLGDFPFAEFLPKYWQQLLHESKINGEAKLAVRMEGPASYLITELVQECVFQSKALQLLAEQRSRESTIVGPVETQPQARGLNCTLSIVPDSKRARCDIAGEIEASSFLRCQLPRWKVHGTVDARELRLQSEAGQLGAFDFSLELGEGTEVDASFQLRCRDLPLAVMFPLEVLEGQADLIINGSYKRSSGLSYEAYLHFSELLVRKNTLFSQKLGGRASGFILLRHAAGQDQIPAMLFSDSRFHWVAEGWIHEDSQWEIHGQRLRSQGVEAPRIHEIKKLLRFPPASAKQFQLNGPLLLWDDEGK